MRRTTKFPQREYVFVGSLKYHGFREATRRKNLKLKCGYIIHATQKEDSNGIDFWVKMPYDNRLLPVQVTQRGIKMFKKYKREGQPSLSTFIKKSNKRIAQKRKVCKDAGIVFVLVRDFDGMRTNKSIAWGDIKALRYGIAHLRRWL